MFDENILIVEAKAGNISNTAKRGGVPSIRDAIKNIIDEAYIQGMRTKEYIVNNQNPKFLYEDGSIALEIKNKDDYKNIYLININLQNLGALATCLSNIKKIGFIQGKEWPWAVFLNDLKVISEILDSPSEFLLYLQRRVRSNNYPQFYGQDELDIFGYFLDTGMYLEKGPVHRADKFILYGFTEKLDKYYDYIGNRGPKVDKPKFKITDDYKLLIKTIEATQKKGFSHVTTSLLSLDSRTQKVVAEQMNNNINRSKIDGIEHDFTMLLDDNKTGMTFNTIINNPNYEKFTNYCKFKMYQTKRSEWILITTKLHENNTTSIDFSTFYKEWEFDPTLEKQLKASQGIHAKVIRPFKIGRNEKCPCGSGLKYKKCCGVGKKR